MTKSVVYSTTGRISCACSESPTVVLCLTDPDLLAPVACPESVESMPYDFTTIEAVLTKAYKSSDSCGEVTWTYVLAYDENLLADPATALTSAEIDGLFCKGCLTTWIEEKIGDEVKLTQLENGDILFTSQHGCEYIFNTEVGEQCSYIATSQAEWDEAITLNLPIILCGEVTLSELTILENQLTILASGRIDTNGFEFVINGALDAGAYQIFDTAVDLIGFGANATTFVYPEWFGATGDGSTDDTTAIQIALNAASTSKVPLVPRNEATYRVSQIVLGAYAVITSDSRRRSFAIFKSNSILPMFATTSGIHETFLKFEGIQFDGNNTANSCILITNSPYTTFEDCYFTGASNLVDMTATSGATIFCEGTSFVRCTFNGAPGAPGVPDIGIKIAGLVNDITIDSCSFRDNFVTAAIKTLSTWDGVNLNVLNSVFRVEGTYAMDLERATSGFQSALIQGNKFDCTASFAILFIRSKVTAVITANDIKGTTPHSIRVDGESTQIFGNVLAESTTAGIGVTSNATDVQIGVQNWGALGAGAYFTDAGTRTIIAAQATRRKGTTLQRPNPATLAGAHLLATQVWGVYLDETLAADGKPIWWNGADWVDGTGAVV